MQKFSLLFLMIGVCLAADISFKAVPIETSTFSENQTVRPPLPGRTVIAQVGDTRTILGPQGKNIVVCEHGDVIAVMYGGPSEPYNGTVPFGSVGIAYSLDYGATWTTYGPINAVSPLRRIYPGLDGMPSFCSNGGQLFFAWQEGPAGYAENPAYVMIEENVPSAPNPSPAILLPGNMYPWFPCPAVNPDDPMNVIVTAWSNLAGGDANLYAWISTDGGYTWTDPPILVATPIGSNVAAGHTRWGTNNYVFMTYHNTYNGVEWPYYVESTDGGTTWTAPATLPAITAVNFWWHELECEVINNMPFVVHNDLDQSGVMQLFYPDPSNPGTVGDWNWVAQNVDVLGAGEILNDTTYTCVPTQYPSISYESQWGTILVSYKCHFTIDPPSPQWPDGYYLGGIMSYDGGITWHWCQPLSGPLYQAASDGAVEAAHRMTRINDTLHVYSTWEDAGDGIIGYQYFERSEPPGICENNNSNAFSISSLRILPSVSRENCHALFSTSVSGEVTVKLYDACGRCLQTVFDGTLGKGEHNIRLNTSGLPNGIYIISLKTEFSTKTAKFIIAH